MLVLRMNTMSRGCATTLLTGSPGSVLAKSQRCPTQTRTKSLTACAATVKEDLCTFGGIFRNDDGVVVAAAIACAVEGP